MEKVSFVEVINPMTEQVTEHAIIEHGDGKFTSMPKSIYDESIRNEA